MAGPGPVEARLDDSVPERIQRVTVSATAARTARGSAAGSQLRVWCNVPVRVAFGPSTVTATAADPLLAANTRLEHTVVDADGYVSFLAEGATTLESACWVGANARTKHQPGDQGRRARSSTRTATRRMRTPPRRSSAAHCAPRPTTSWATCGRSRRAVRAGSSSRATRATSAATRARASVPEAHQVLSVAFINR